MIKSRTCDSSVALFSPRHSANSWIEKFLRSLVRVEIDVRVRMFIPGQKLAQAQRVGRVARTHQDDVALAGSNEFQPAQDEGPHKNLAQLGVLGNQRPQAICTQFQKLTWLGDAAAHKSAPPGDHGHLTGEITGAVCGYGALAPKIRLHDLHASGEQDEKRNIRVVRFKQDFTLLDLTDLAARADAADLGCGQNWKGLGTSVECAGYWQRRHFSS